jgi:hypothetical protein
MKETQQLHRRAGITDAALGELNNFQVIDQIKRLIHLQNNLFIIN